MIMPQAQKYVVCAQPKRPKETLECSKGMCIGVTVGTISLIFTCSVINFHYVFGPVHKKPYRNSIPLRQQGNIMVYPPYRNSHDKSDRNGSYLYYLPPKDTEETVNYLQNLIDGYPTSMTKQHSDCWIENPTYNKPCFFNTMWLGEECTSSTNFGFEEVDETFNPCVIIRLEETGTWAPVTEEKRHLQNKWLRTYDPNFCQFICYTKTAKDIKKMVNITVYPEKGFSTRFFPVSSFNPEYYSLPAVAVQLKGIKKGENITVECGLVAKNNLQLWDNGLIELKFVQ